MSDSIEMIVVDGFYAITNHRTIASLVGPPLGYGPLPPKLEPGETWVSKVSVKYVEAVGRRNKALEDAARHSKPLDIGYNLRFVRALAARGYILVAKEPDFATGEIWAPPPWQSGWGWGPSAVIPVSEEDVAGEMEI